MPIRGEKLEGDPQIGLGICGQCKGKDLIEWDASRPCTIPWVHATDTL